jgi:hypothetical protein
MLFFGIAIVLAVIAGVVCWVQGDVEDGAAGLLLGLIAAGLVAFVLNVFCSGMAHNVLVHKCALDKTGSTYLAQQVTDTTTTLYYHCSDSNKFSPQQIDSYHDKYEIVSGPVAKLEVFDNKTTGSQNLWCTWDAGGRLYRFTVPDASVALGITTSK